MDARRLGLLMVGTQVALSVVLIAAMLLVAALAAIVPALRAARVDPLIAIRSE